jgi:hypothetical protein
MKQASVRLATARAVSVFPVLFIFYIRDGEKGEVWIISIVVELEVMKEI